MSTPLLQLFHHQASGGLRERLCATLRLAIANHHLSVDQKLPSTRQMASDLNLSRVTVEAAYAQLESEGYLRREIGRGSFVAITMPNKARSTALTQLPHFSLRGNRVLATGVARIRSFHRLLPPVRQNFAPFLSKSGGESAPLCSVRLAAR